jgi:hypothetical protein
VDGLTKSCDLQRKTNDWLVGLMLLYLLPAIDLQILYKKTKFGLFMDITLKKGD